MLDQSYQMSCQQAGEIGIHNILEPAVRIQRQQSIVCVSEDTKIEAVKELQLGFQVWRRGQI